MLQNRLDRIDVYVSYSHQDRDAADAIVYHLKSIGLSVWYQEDLLLAGETWREKIIETLNRSRKVIVLWSASSIKSQFVRDEAHRALDDGKLFPVLIKGLKADALPVPFNLINSAIWRNSDDFGIISENLLRDVHSAVQAAPAAGAPTATQAAPGAIGTQAPVPVDAEYTKRPHAAKTRVFIAHASNDKHKLSEPITVLVEMGFKVWIDKPEELDVAPHILKRIGTERIHYGEDWRERISRAIKRTDRVFGCWSTDAIRGRREQFYYEIYLGLVQQKLIQCRIDGVPYDEIGMPYTFNHIADLSSFKKGKYCLPLDQLMEDLGKPKSIWSWAR